MAEVNILPASDARIIVPRAGVDSTLLQWLNEKEGDQLGKLLDTRLPVYQMRDYEDEIIVGTKSLTSVDGLSPFHFKLTVADDECIEVFLASITVTTGALIYEIFLTTSIPGATAQDIELGTVSTVANFNFVLLSAVPIGGIRASDVLRREAGPVTLVGKDFKNGAAASDVLNFKTTAVAAAAAVSKLKFMAKRVPVPARWRNGVALLSDSTIT